MRRIGQGAAAFAVADDKDTFWDRVEDGRWEPETLAAIADLVGPGTLLIDIGAWIGPITLAAAARGARVLAFEPDPRAHALLEGNVAANPALAGRIARHHRAVAPAAGPVRLGSPKKQGDSMGSVLLADTATIAWEAQAVTPAEVAALAGDAPRIVVKIDIEGGEYALLPHMAPLLGARTAAVLAAFHPRLLAAQGMGGDEIAARTQAARAALAAFSATALDGPDDAISQGANTTVLFRRA